MLDDQAAHSAALMEALECLFAMNNDYAYAMNRAVRAVCQVTGMGKESALNLLFGERVESVNKSIRTFAALSEAFPESFKMEVMTWDE